MSRLLLSLSFAAALLAGRMASAQAAPELPAELQRLQQEFEQKVKAESADLNTAYDKLLAAQEKAHAAVGDYAQARSIKARRDELALMTPGIAKPAGVELLPASARLTGVSATRAGELQGWRSPSYTADWTLSRYPPGKYQLQLSYTMITRPSDSSASSRTAVEAVDEAIFNIREDSRLSIAQGNNLNFTLKNATTEWKTITVDGVLDLSRPPVTLRMGPKGTYAGNVIALKDLRLVPVTPSETPGVVKGPVSLAERWKALQQTQAQRIAAVRKPVVEAHIAALKDKLTAAPDDEALATAIAAEERRARRRLDPTTDSSGAGSMKLDSFTEISGALLVPDPSNTGDHFLIEHQGHRIPVRLAWITCPPVDPADRKGLKQAVEGFGGDELAALSLGRSAQDFTAGYLEGHPLRLLVRPAKKTGEVPSALVYIEDVGLYQNVLLEQGLALLDAPSNGNQSPLETALLKGMAEHQDAARQHSPPVGGWALKNKP